MVISNEQFGPIAQAHLDKLAEQGITVEPGGDVNMRGRRYPAMARNIIRWNTPANESVETSDWSFHFKHPNEHGGSSNVWVSQDPDKPKLQVTVNPIQNPFEFNSDIGEDVNKYRVSGIDIDDPELHDKLAPILQRRTTAGSHSRASFNPRHSDTSPMPRDLIGVKSDYNESGAEYEPWDRGFYNFQTRRMETPED